MQLEKMKKLLVVTALLAVPCLAAYYLAFLVRFDGALPESAQFTFAYSVLWVMLVKVATLLHARIHLHCARYVTFQDMLSLVRSVTISSVAILLVDAMLFTEVVIPRSVVVLDWGTTILLLAAVRIAPRLVRDGYWHRLSEQNGCPALIIGANDAGEALLRSLRSNPTMPYRVVGFLDDRTEYWGRRIAGVPVLGTQTNLPTLVLQHHIQEVLITSGTLPGKDVRRLVELASRENFRVKVLPSYEQLVGETVDVNPRSVAIADLLQRPSVQLDEMPIRDWLTGKVVLVSGSAGSIGSEICRQLVELAPAKIVIVDRSETGQFFLERELGQLAPHLAVEVAMADLTDAGRMHSVFEKYRPQIVFHAAAYKHVPLMEAHAGEAIKNIVLATKNMVDLAEEFKAESLVMISTDKAVNPTSVMGSCKRLAEQYIEAKADTSPCRLVTVRFGNVLDSAGSVVPIFREQIARGGPVTVTHPDMIRYFMLIPEAAQLVIQAGAMGRGGEIFVLDMGEPVRIMDLARDMIRLSGLRVDEDIEIVVTGLRPGEKLYEELYGADEQHLPTGHDKIMTAVGRPRQLIAVLNDIRQLSEILDEPNEIVLQALAEVIPVLPPTESQPSVRRAA
ncbi:polysaccharide biosynthesis protein [Bythopirellula goksoeyrii]|uniref:UDP-N-acetyl-alpha-D-glucosamine C6 dehydratase n=1 Tax=Bythopirellula goksoeyrii TaxID=1400387 RepID=A0A5B9QEV2_9BACT|nr:nucleoside-diphosphate sugar epimerase/dehydratase [Bythopirellula goksoeyrii]QEG36170.1 UDP-N-acetyl-alpha-D-glucosamine C6 dehydratase [Bythopirellula goksoeyrii]